MQGVPFNEGWLLPQEETSFLVPSLRSRSHLDQFLVNTDKEDSKISRIVRETPHVLPETRIDDHDHIGGDEGHLTQFYVVRIPVQQGSEVGIVESIRGFRHKWEQDGSILQAGPQVHPVPFDVLPSPLSSCLQQQENRQK